MIGEILMQIKVVLIFDNAIFVIIKKQLINFVFT